MNPERTYYTLINEPEVVSEVVYQESRENDPLKFFRALAETQTREELYQMMCGFYWLKMKAEGKEIPVDWTEDAA